MNYRAMHHEIKVPPKFNSFAEADRADHYVSEAKLRTAINLGGTFIFITLILFERRPISIKVPLKIVFRAFPVTVQFMARANRVSPGGIIYHALNRSNRGERLFHKAGDYQAFQNLLGEALARYQRVKTLGYCIMPNHWHLVLEPEADGELSKFIGWLTNAHVKRYHQHYGTYGQGHVYQGRFKSFPVQADDHLLILLRYFEANAMRAKLVDSSDLWRWSSMAGRKNGIPWLAPWPVDEPPNWLQIVNDRALEEIAGIKQSLERGAPFGSDRWIQSTAKRCNLFAALKPRGRPMLKKDSKTRHTAD